MTRVLFCNRIASLEEQLEHAQQEQRNLHGYAQKLQMLVQELQRTHTTKQQQRAQVLDVTQ